MRGRLAEMEGEREMKVTFGAFYNWEVSDKSVSSQCLDSHA